MRTLDRPDILYSCYQQRSREGEQFIAEHVFGMIISGTQKLFVGGKTYEFGPGDLRFFQKDQLCRFEKEPPLGGEFLSVSVFLTKDTLRAMSTEMNLHADATYTGDAIRKLAPNKLLQNYLDSLSPYLHGSGNTINPALTDLKVREAVMLLLQSNPDLRNALFDLSEPGKIDLQSFMNANYRFNVDISRFAYLTGRSLATFKRDFERIYHTSPNRWLQQQRLNDAYFLIKQKGKPVSEVYLEVGFKDLSHFSFAFKKAYGISPTKI